QPSVILTQRYLDVSRSGETRVLEHVQQNISHLVLSRHRPGRPLGSTQLPLHLSIAHLLETDDVLDDCCDIDIDRRRKIGGRAPLAAERARDLVQAVYLGQNSSHVVIQYRIEIDARIGARASQVLYTESNWSEGILDLVGNLAGHLSPRQHAFGARN